jgi:hypothetical protein
MNSDEDTRGSSPWVGCPIRRPRDHRSLASPPGFSQRAASFIASQCQGIHQMPLIYSTPGVSRETPFAGRQGSGIRDQNRGIAAVRSLPTRPSAAMKTLRTHPEPCGPGHIRLGHITSLSSPVNHHPARGVAAGEFLASSPSPQGDTPDAWFLAPGARLLVPEVEVIGLEPTPSCLQSRRSPS